MNSKNYLSTLQAEHFEKVHDRYQEHYYDEYSLHYRSEVISKKIDVELSRAKKVLEIGCGGGANYREFIKRGHEFLRYHAVDISASAVDEFNKNVPAGLNAVAFELDFTSTVRGLSNDYDLVLFYGVLHHMTNDLAQVFESLSKIVTRNGKIVFIEPNKGFLNFLRRLWYRLSDDFDHQNERALDISEVNDLAKVNGFYSDKSVYFGNLGFFIILQSMILRTPKRVKALLTRPLTRFDLWVEQYQSKYTLAMFFCSYVKSDQHKMPKTNNEN